MIHRGVHLRWETRCCDLTVRNKQICFQTQLRTIAYYTYLVPMGKLRCNNSSPVVGCSFLHLHQKLVSQMLHFNMNSGVKWFGSWIQTVSSVLKNDLTIT